MHKTASTYIQMMLAANREILHLNNIEYAAMNRDILFKSIRSRNFSPWKELIEKSKKTSTLLISDERLSNILAQKQNNRLIVANGAWLTKKLKPHIQKITVIGFIRDQPEFINSQFCQNSKRFSPFTSSNFDQYIKEVFSSKHNLIECNPQKLFNWSLRSKLVETIFMPYNNPTKKDPFTQLIQKIMPDAEQIRWNQIEAINETPGLLTILMANKIRKYIRKQNLFLTPKERLQLSFELISTTDLLGWNTAKFDAISKKRYALIRDHYRADNNKFALRAWGKEQWDDIFPAKKQFATNCRVGIFNRLEVRKQTKEFITTSTILNNHREVIS